MEFLLQHRLISTVQRNRAYVMICVINAWSHSTIGWGCKNEVGMDNVICGDKTINDCEEYINAEN